MCSKLLKNSGTMFSLLKLINTLQFNRKFLIKTRPLVSNRIQPFSSGENNETPRKIPHRILKRLKAKGLTENDVMLEEREPAKTMQTKLKSQIDDMVIAEDIKEEFPSDKELKIPAGGDQTQHAFRPKVDPSETSLLLFPGQGSQFVGMGKKLLEYKGAKEIYVAANEILGYNLLDLCLNGPKEELNKTVVCQPAVFVTSVAATEKLQDIYPDVLNTCVGSAGFSVGEYSALVYSGVLSFEDALRIVKIRAEAMQEASEMEHSGMMTVFLNNKSELKQAMLAARDYCEQKLQIENPICSIANYLSFDCKVVAGHMEALKFIMDNKELFHIKRTKMIPVSGAFHTRLMQTARAPVVNALRQSELHKPLFRVHSNVTAKKYRHPKEMIDLLSKQIIKPVKWEQTLHVLFAREQGQNFPKTFEVGPGNQLGTMLKMVNLAAFKSYTNIPV